MKLNTAERIRGEIGEGAEIKLTSHSSREVAKLHEALLTSTRIVNFNYQALSHLSTATEQ